MSMVVEDVGRAFEGFTKNIFTVLGLIAGIAVLSFALPYIIGLVTTITGLTGYAGTALPAAPGTTSNQGTTTV